MSTFQLDGLLFTVRRSACRKTVGITIERDGSLAVTAPVGLPQAEIERIAATKQGWIYSKLAQRKQFGLAPTGKEFVPGESFSLLGRRYRLIWADDEDGPPLRLEGDRFFLRRSARHQAEDLFRRFYIEHGHDWLPRRVARLADRIGVEPGELRIRDLGHRWGSCGSRYLNFNWRAMQLPPRIIEYVVAHELVHVIVPNHGPEFWRRLERAMPDFARRKDWLAEHGREF